LIERDKIPANVQTLSAGDFDHAASPDLLDAIARRLPGIALGDQTGNEFQRDLNYRGFTVSPVIGTPQGWRSIRTGSVSTRFLAIRSTGTSSPKPPSTA
jgi:iron complex outermembrane receptor protein